MAETRAQARWRAWVVLGATLVGMAVTACGLRRRAEDLHHDA